jgi:hypothetical protein
MYSTRDKIEKNLRVRIHIEHIKEMPTRGSELVGLM